MARLARVTLVVSDYDEAIAWFTERLGFTLLEDGALSETKRWVRLSAGSGSELLLARAANEAQAGAVGASAGGRVAFFLETDDFDRDHAAFRARGVEFEEAPRDESYGRVAVFRDLYGNRWDLVQSSERASS